VKKDKIKNEINFDSDIKTRDLIKTAGNAV
jgi:hypothetical protein